jgi:hypothetical protein
MHDGKWNIIPDQEIYTNTVMRKCIEFNFGRDILEGALLYNIQKQHSEPDEFVQNESKCIQLLVTWCSGRTGGLQVCAFLVEHDKELDKDKLRRLHQKYWHLLDTRVDPNESNRLLSDTIVLETTIKIMNGGYRWDIFISEGVESNIGRPLWIDTTR